MLRVTRLTDYGIALLGLMARDSRGCFCTRDLARRAGLPLSTATKILKSLCRHGLLESQRGNGGGYTLARIAAKITVAEIIVAIEGPIAVTQGGVSGQSHACPIGANWALLNNAVNQALAEVTLEAMLRDQAVGLSIHELKGRL